MSRINPRIIVAYASGYGLSGPYLHRRGQDLAAQALSGLMALTGNSRTGPVPVGTFIVDYLASMQFAQGMMIALAARDRTGRGQVVDSNLLNAAIASHLQEGTTYLNTGQRYDRPPEGVAHAHNTALYGYYQAGDGRWLTLIGEFYIDKPWQRCARACGLPPAAVDDPRFATIEGLRTHVEETHRLLADAIAGFSREEIMARFAEEDVLVAPVHDYDAVFDDPQVRNNGLVLDADVEGVGPVKFVGMPVTLSDTPPRLRLVPPKVGQHNDDVLLAAGYTADEISDLKAAGAIGDEADRERDGEPPRWS
jgi:formyl-CoA transferase